MVAIVAHVEGVNLLILVRAAPPYTFRVALGCSILACPLSPILALGFIEVVKEILFLALIQ